MTVLNILKGIGVTKVLGIAGLALAGVAALVSNYANEKAMEEMIEEKVNEAIANDENEEESV